MSGEPTDDGDRGDGDPDAVAADDDPDASGRDATDEPLSALADRIRRSRERRERDATSEGDPFAALERGIDREGSEPAVDGPTAGGADGDGDPFDRMEVDAIDEETMWESLEADEATTADRPAIGVGADAERVERDDPGARRPDHVVEKGAYCHRCRFLSDPPEIRCTHEGTEIVEVVDSERFRVRGCPMVARGGAVDRDPDRSDRRDDGRPNHDGGDST